MRNLRAGPVPARRSRHGVAAALLAAASFVLVPGAAHADPMSDAIASAHARPAAKGAASSDVAAFYAVRQGRPMWLAGGQLTPAAFQLLGLLDSAHFDRLNRARYMTPALTRALSEAGRDAKSARRAEELLSQAFVTYVRDLRTAPAAGMTFVDAAVRPTPPLPRALLGEAADAPSLADYVQNMRWMNPLYAPLRRALSTNNFADNRERALLEVNLERTRVLPPARGRFVLVNAAAQKLFMYENGQPVDSMRVVVGKPKHATPMLTAMIQFASLNPYWNVPPDLAAERIAPEVVKTGLSYMRSRGYEVLSSWDDGAATVDPATVDWKAVADGSLEVRVRQLPGPSNSMGQMKFMFPNQFGVYLHDTPDKELLTEASRFYSGGCVRLEDAQRLGQWLFGKKLETASDQPELPVNLPVPVPVAITYLTAVPSGSSIVYFDDIYGRDAQRLAQAGGGGAAIAAR